MKTNNVNKKRVKVKKKEYRISFSPTGLLLFGALIAVVAFFMGAHSSFIDNVLLNYYF